MKLPWLILFLGVSGSVFAVESNIFNADNLESITIDKPGLYPESIDYNPITDKFIVGSVRDGGVYEIDMNGGYRRVINDNRLNSTLAVRIDAKRDRLLVANSDVGSSVNPYIGGTKKLASLGIYELSTGKYIDYINLGELLPNKDHLANGMTLDSKGNIYVTDSLAPVIYKIDTHGHASIFLKSDRFLGEDISLNGIVFHPDGYLITIKKNDGVLFKIPLSNPQQFSMIKLSQKFIGGDGLVLINNNELVVIANHAAGEMTEAVFSLNSTDGWETAKVTRELKMKGVYLTTGVMKKDKLYVMHSNLRTLILTPPNNKSQLNRKAVIQQIAY
jgi:outer membrane protein assembly factor BamB